MAATLPADPPGEAAGADDLSAALPLPGGGRALVASRRGRLHAHRGDHREDAAAWRAGARAWCVAVADGAGSAPHSRVGAWVATQAVTRAVLHALEQEGAAPSDALARGADAAQHALDMVATRAPCAPRALRTTLLVAAGVDDRLALMQVGDGAIVCGGRARAFRQPIAAHAGDFSGEVTHFLPDPGAVEALRASIVDVPDAEADLLLLATDGVEDPWYPLHRTAAGLLATLAGEAPAPGALPDGLVIAAVEAAAGSREGGVLAAPDAGAALLAWLGFEKRGENDDRTLAVVLRPAARAWLPSAAR